MIKLLGIDSMTTEFNIPEDKNHLLLKEAIIEQDSMVIN